MVKRNTRTADFTEDTRVPWWKERIPEVKEVDGGIYKDLIEAAAKAAADTLDLKTRYRIIFVDALPESTGMGVNCFNRVSGRDAVILVVRHFLDEEEGIGNKVALIFQIAFHEVRHIKQHETVHYYLWAARTARRSGTSYRVVKHALERDQGIKIEEKESRVKKWIYEDENYESKSGEKYLVQDSELDARAFERFLSAGFFVTDFHEEAIPEETSRVKEFWERYSKKAIEPLEELWKTLEDFQKKIMAA